MRGQAFHATAMDTAVRQASETPCSVQDADSQHPGLAGPQMGAGRCWPQRPTAELVCAAHAEGGSGFESRDRTEV